jgi:hypothetical protein
VDATRESRAGLRTAAGVSRASLIVMTLADRITRRLEDVLMRWARERAGTTEQDFVTRR